MSASPVTRGRLTKPSPLCRELITEVTNRVLAECEEIVRHIDDEVVAALPELADDQVRADLHASTAGNVEFVLMLMREWTDPGTIATPPQAIVWARSLVSRGVTVETLIRIYRLGHARFWDRWSAALTAATDDAALLGEASALTGAYLFAYIDAVLQPLIADFVAERERLQRSAEATRVEEIRAILDGRQNDEAAASARLGYDLARGHVGFVVWTEPGEDEESALSHLESAAEAVAAALDLSARPLRCAGGRLMLAVWVAVAEPASADAVRAAARELRAFPGVRVAVGDRGRGIEGFRDTHAEARTARRVMRALGSSRRAIARYTDLRLTAMLTEDIAQAQRFVSRELGPLVADDDATKRLTATLAVYQEEQLSFARASRRLGVHENTVAYRMRRVQELTGQTDLGSLELRTAVHLLPIVRG